MAKSPMNYRAKKALAAAVSAALPATKLGATMAGRRLVIVAENNSIANVSIWIDAVPMFNASQTAVEIEYQLVVDRVGDKPRRTTVDEGVVKRALKQKTDVIVAAAVDQIGWLGANCPEFDELMAPYMLNKAAKKTSKSSRPKRI